MRFQRCGCFILDETCNYTVIVLTKSVNPEYRKWGIPKGSKEVVDASNLECSLRETVEETGIDIKKYQYELLETLSYKLKIWGVSYDDSMFIIKLNHSTSDIKLSLDTTELDEVRWVRLVDLKRMINETPSKFNSVVRTILHKSALVNKLIKAQKREL